MVLIPGPGGGFKMFHSTWPSSALIVSDYNDKGVLEQESVVDGVSVSGGFYNYPTMDAFVSEDFDLYSLAWIDDYRNPTTLSVQEYGYPNNDPLNEESLVVNHEPLPEKSSGVVTVGVHMESNGTTTCCFFYTDRFACKDLPDGSMAFNESWDQDYVDPDHPSSYAHPRFKSFPWGDGYGIISPNEVRLSWVPPLTPTSQQVSHSTSLPPLTSTSQQVSHSTSLPVPIPPSPSVPASLPSPLATDATLYFVIAAVSALALVILGIAAAVAVYRRRVQSSSRQTIDRGAVTSSSSTESSDSSFHGVEQSDSLHSRSSDQWQPGGDYRGVSLDDMRASDPSTGPNETRSSDLSSQGVKQSDDRWQPGGDYRGVSLDDMRAIGPSAAKTEEAVYWEAGSEY